MSDWNETDITIIKIVIDEIAKPLTHICNLSFQIGKFLPKSYPSTKGEIDFFKKQQASFITVTILQDTQKTFHCLTQYFIEKHNLLSDSQYRCRTNRSAALALMELRGKTNSIE